MVLRDLARRVYREHGIYPMNPERAWLAVCYVNAAAASARKEFVSTVSHFEVPRFLADKFAPVIPWNIGITVPRFMETLHDLLWTN